MSLSRRDFVRSSAAIAVLSVPACGALSTDPGDDDDGPSKVDLDAKEAPSLAAQVKDGSLPRLEERLPKKPLVVEPVDGPGAYGGTWRNVLLGANTTDVYRMVAYDGLVRWAPDWRSVIPNLAEAWNINGDGKEYVFRLRRGVRWSDGEPFTADDIVFAYEDLMLDAKLFGSVPQEFVAGGKPAKVTRHDEYTVGFTFTEPNGLFLERLACPGFGSSAIIAPKHYLQQFHPKYNKSAESEWPDIMETHGGTGSIALSYWANTDMPTVFAWKPSVAMEEGKRSAVERNPYYWKTDADGRQLPYLDGIDFDTTSDAEILLLKASGGNIDFNTTPDLCTVKNKPVFAKNKDRGPYNFIDVIDSRMNYLILSLNLNHRDTALREVLGNKDFRIGLSYAINRKEIIDAAYQGQGQPWQAAPRKESDYYLEGLATQYTSYDVDKANEHLDAAGFSDRDGDGTRLRSDGEPIKITILVGNEGTAAAEAVSAMELIKGYWKAVGVEMFVKPVTGELLVERTETGDFDGIVAQGDGGHQDALLDPRWYFPFSHRSAYALAWKDWWLTDGTSGERPPAPVRRQMELYDELASTTDMERRTSLFIQLLEIAQDQFYVIGTVLPTQAYGVKNDNFMNVAATLNYAWLYPLPGPIRPEQFSLRA